jgi:hypothetical protein
MGTKTARPTKSRAAHTVPDEGSQWPSPALAAALYLGLALVFFLPAFLPGRHIFGTDYFAGGYPFYAFIGDRLSIGELPKWVPFIFGGMPLFANPGSTYQPVHLLADLVLPTSRVLPTVFVVHFWLAGLGMYLLARELRCRSGIAFVTGISFQFTGILLSWVYAGHDGRIIVATMAPLVLFFLHRGIRTGAVAPFAGASAALAFALLSFQIQNSYYLLLGAAIWALFCLIHLDLRRRPRELARVVAMGLGAVAFAFLISAVNFLPFQSYVPESPRGMEGGRGYEYSISFSMPVPEVLSLAVPEQAGASVADPATGEPLFPAYVGQNPFKLHTEYGGALVVLLLALGVLYARSDRYWQFFLGLGLFMLTIALGGNTPLYRLYYEILPGTKQFRAPSLSFFMVVLSLVAMAAITLEHVARLRDRTRGSRPDPEATAALDRVLWVGGALVGVALLGMLGATGDVRGAAAGPSVALGWARFAFFAGLTAALLIVWIRERIVTVAFVVALSVVTVADLWLVGRRFMHTADPPGVTFAPDDVVRFLMDRPGPVRAWMFPFPAAYPGGGPYGSNYPMLHGIEQVGGEHPNQLQRWNEYLGAGTEMYIEWQNFVADGSVVETPEGQAISFRDQAGFLAAANVGYVVSLAPLVHPNLREVHRGSALIYENTAALPRAYLVPEVESVPREQLLGAMIAADWDPRQLAFVPDDARVALPGGPLDGDAEVVAHEPDRVVVRARADRPALLVLADNDYPGWQVTVNGVEAELVRTNHTFRGVVVGAGESEVVFEFRPTLLYVGFYIYLAGFALLLAYAAFLLLGRYRARRVAMAAE